MSFTRVNPPGWAVGAKLTSSQQNALDIDHANAVDKTGDTISAATITLANLASLNVGDGTFAGRAGVTIKNYSSVQDNANNIIWNGAGIMFVGAASALQGTIANAIVPTVAAGISDGGITGGIKATVAGGITAATASGISSGTAGGFQLSGGPTDWPTFSAARSFTICVPMTPAGLSSGWGAGNGFYLVGPAASAVQGVLVPWPPGVRGATLSSVSLVFAVGSSHSGVPANLVGLSVNTLTGQAGFGTTPSSLSTVSPQYAPTPASGAAWYNSGNTQLATFTCNQFNTNLPTNTQALAIGLYDEYGTNSIAGNQFVSLLLNFTNVTSMHLW